MRSRFLPTRLLRAAVISVVALGLTGGLAACGGDDAGTSGKLRIVTGFYPLQYVGERIAGDHAAITSLTRPGAEPHDVQLAPRDVAAVSKADLAIHLKGFQPAVDDAIAAQAPAKAFDVAPAARLGLTADAEDGHDHADTGADPHFWLDPTRLADVAVAVRDRLIELDPDHRGDYETNAAALAADLKQLDAEFTAGLKSCTNRDLVTSHRAFAYLADRYDLHQVAIAGLSPEAEPDAATLARVADRVRERRIATIYYETLVSPDVARTLARETGARTAVLDPIEGLTDASAARDYLGLMRANLTALTTGLPCR